jgi:hypothetical protein
MPTYDQLEPFRRDYAALTERQRSQFQRAVEKFIADLRRGSFRKGLRIKGLEGHPGLWELSWAGDGRATFEYGDEVRVGHPHIIWRRIGTHDILDNP